MKKQQKAQKPETPRRKSPNLLNNIQRKKPEEGFIEKEHRKIISTLKIICVLTQIFLITLVILNVRADRKLVNKQITLDTLSTEVDDMEEIQSKTKNVISRINLYKVTEKERTLLGERTDKFLTLIPPTVSINSALFDEKAFILHAQAYSALEFSLLISTYFDNDLVKEVALKRVQLAPYSQMYDVEIEAVYK
jgi:hypothetical protein